MNIDFTQINHHKIRQSLFFNNSFIVTAISILLFLRNKSIRRSYATNTLNFMTKCLLKYQHNRHIDNHFYYLKRTGIYLILSNIVDISLQIVGCQHFKNVVKGSLWGVCFGLVPLGVGMGCIGGLIENQIDRQIKQLL